MAENTGKEYSAPPPAYNQAIAPAAPIAAPAQPVGISPYLVQQQPMVQPQPIMQHQPIMQPQPIMKPQPIMQPQPIGFVQPAPLAYAQPQPVGYVAAPVVMASPVPYFGPYAQQVTCPRCQAQVCSEIRYVTSGSAMMYCLILFILGLILIIPLLFCWVPLVIDACKDVEHICPQCKNVIGIYKRMSNFNSGRGGYYPRYGPNYYRGPHHHHGFHHRRSSSFDRNQPSNDIMNSGSYFDTNMGSGFDSNFPSGGVSNFDSGFPSMGMGSSMEPSFPTMDSGPSFGQSSFDRDNF